MANKRHHVDLTVFPHEPSFSYTQQVSHQRWIWGSQKQESTGSESTQKEIHSGFEIQARRHQKSEIGVSVAPGKGLKSSKNLKKEEFVDPRKSRRTWKKKKC